MFPVYARIQHSLTISYQDPDEEPEYYEEVQQQTGFEDDGASTELRDQLARKLVRYAISCEYSRRPIKRQDITAKVLDVHSRQFRPVFAEAQMMLEATFGMMMVELPRQEKVTMAQKRGRSHNACVPVHFD
jgi:hypothetical protein